MQSLTGKWISGMLGALVGYFASTGWLILICILMIFVDSYTAYQLSSRASKKFPGTSHGKFKSNSAMKALRKIRDVVVLIVLAYLIEDKIIIMFDFYLPYIVSGAFCFVEAWSILENNSSCNDSRWARLLQKVMVDKTARHFDLDSNSLNDFLNGKTDHINNAGTGSAPVVQDSETNVG